MCNPTVTRGTVEIRLEGVPIPEGPELRRSADQLGKWLLGTDIINAFPSKTGRYALDPPKGYEAFVAEMREHGPGRVTEVNVKGKFMWWRVQYPGPGKTWWVWITYGMSGQWSRELTKHTAFGVHYRGVRDANGVAPDHSSLYFNDARHFGTLKFVDNEKEHLRKLETLGPDMLSDPPTWKEFMGCLLKRPRRTLAETLMDQSVVSGVGNYVKAEALYGAKLSPHRRVDTLTVFEMEQLRKQIMWVMSTSYDSGGATLYTYQNSDGTRGEAQRRFVVYGNKTDLEGNEVVKEETLDGRTTWWVPSIQK